MRGKSHAEVTLRARQFDATDAAVLLEQADATNVVLYGHPDATPLYPADFDPRRHGLFLVAYDGGSPVACGGYRRYPEDPSGRTAEVKRMYVAAECRRCGLGRAILAHLEDSARSDGYSRIILDVGSKQPAAHGLYEAAGYHRISGFSIYRDSPGNRAYAKDL